MRSKPQCLNMRNVHEVLVDRGVLVLQLRLQPFDDLRIVLYGGVLVGDDSWPLRLSFALCGVEARKQIYKAQVRSVSQASARPETNGDKRSNTVAW